MTNTWERFHAATLSLTRSGPIKERLNDAYHKHLADLRVEELPEQIREDFRAFACSLRREPPEMRGDDPVRATIRKMSSSDADYAATSVVRMFSALPRSAAAARAQNSATVVSLFSAESR